MITKTYFTKIKPVDSWKPSYAAVVNHIPKVSVYINPSPSSLRVQSNPAEGIVKDPTITLIFLLPFSHLNQDRNRVGLPVTVNPLFSGLSGRVALGMVEPGGWRSDGDCVFCWTHLWRDYLME